MVVINTNTSAATGARLLGESTSALRKSLARLSSGSKIVSPEDDAAGMAVSSRFDAQIHRLQAARTNVSNVISYSQTQDGFLSKVSKALDRMSELTILAQDASKSDADRSLYDAEFSKLGAYIDDLATKDFNGVSLFDGAGLDVTTDSEGNTLSVDGIDLTDTIYTTATSASVGTVTNAVSALASVLAAVDKISTDRATIGANVSVLNSYSEQLSVLRDNLSAANSRIKDVDVAEESTLYARYNILVQAGTAMLAQANAVPQAALRLLS